MARKHQQLIIDAPGRDCGKAFLLHEMPARQAQYWGMRMLAAMARSGIDVVDSVADSGMAGVAFLGVAAVLGSGGTPEVRALLDELMDACVAIIPDPSRPAIFRGAQAFRAIDGRKPVGAMTDDDIEEIPTLFTLQKEVLQLHTDFFPPAIRSAFERAWKKAVESLQNMPISTASSAP